MLKIDFEVISKEGEAARRTQHWLERNGATVNSTRFVGWTFEEGGRAEIGKVFSCTSSVFKYLKIKQSCNEINRYLVRKG